MSVFLQGEGGEVTTMSSSSSGGALPVPECRNYRSSCSHDEMNPKRRSTMEDCHRIIPALGGDDCLSYFGVYDGHGGRQIVDFLETTLEENVAEELRQPDDAAIPERLARACLITDMLSRRSDITTSGATAVSVLIKADADANTKELYCANVGDSRAVLACREKRGKADGSGLEWGYVGKRLSYDHRAEDEDEQRRIKDAGGFIIRARVLGILAVSRSFGDHGMKDFVTANPHVSQVTMKSPDEHPFLILACDGVWDVFTDQEAVDFLLDEFSRAPDRAFTEADAARLLVLASIERGSADNITAIVVYF
jgi:serine/threonine protein phosphatase PrpC